MSTVRETLAERQGLAREEELPALSERLTVIQPASRIPKLDFQELWQYRELALTFGTSRRRSASRGRCCSRS
jgi:hypothetical protein